MPLWNSIILETQDCSLLLAGLSLNITVNQIPHGVGKSTLLSPCIAYVPDMAILYTQLLSEPWGGWREKLNDVYKLALLVHLIIEFSMQLIPMIMRYKNPHSVTILSGSSSYTSSQDLLVNNSSALFLPSS